MLQLTDTVSSLAHEVSDSVVTLAHEVASKAQDAAQVAGDRGKELAHVATKQGKKAVKAGRSTLHSINPKPAPSHKGRNLLVVLLVAVIGFVAWKAASRRKGDDNAGSFGEAERIADKNHVHVA